MTIACDVACGAVVGCTPGGVAEKAEFTLITMWSRSVVEARATHRCRARAEIHQSEKRSREFNASKRCMIIASAHQRAAGSVVIVTAAARVWCNTNAVNRIAALGRARGYAGQAIAYKGERMMKLFD